MYADRIRELALSFSQTYEDRPWGFPLFYRLEASSNVRDAAFADA